MADTYHLTCLPKVFYKGEVVRHTSKGDATLSHSVQEWFEDYHEWHLSLDDSGRQQITVWDMGKGYRTFSLEEGAEIHRQAAKIITLCYDFRTGRQINPWSHAAGDFVVKVDERSFSVRLTTVRGYEPLPLFREERSFDPLIRISYFFLNLTVRMRLDRLDGIGSVLWAESSILHPVVSGFCEALSSKEAHNRYTAGDIEKGSESPSGLSRRIKSEPSFSLCWTIFPGKKRLSLRGTWRSMPVTWRTPCEGPSNPVDRFRTLQVVASEACTGMLLPWNARPIRIIAKAFPSFRQERESLLKEGFKEPLTGDLCLQGGCRA